MATPKGLTRKITRKQALSYQRLVPNGIGVTAISAVNGRGAYAVRAVGDTRSASGAPRAARGAYGANKKRQTPAQKAAFKKMQAGRKKWLKAKAAPKRARRNGEPFRMVAGLERSEGGYERAARRVRPALHKVRAASERVIDAARGGYQKAYKTASELLGGHTVRRAKRVVGIPVIGIGSETVHAVRAKRRRAASTTETKMKKKSSKRRTPAQKRALAKMLAGLKKYRKTHKKGAAKKSRRVAVKRSAPRKRRATAAQLRNLKKARRAAKKWRLAQGYKGNKKTRRSAKKPAKRTRKTAKRYSPISVKLGKRSVRTAMYRSGKGVKHLPIWASAGAKTARQFAAATRPGTKVAESKAGARIRKRVAAIMRARGRSAARTARAGDIFTPNRGTVVPFTTWSESMHRNKSKKRKSAKRSKRSAGRKLTMHQIRSRAAKKAAKTRKAKKLARSLAGKKAAKKRTRKHSRKATRRVTHTRKTARRARKHPRKFHKNAHHARRHVHANKRRSYLPIRVARMHFEENMKANRRRHHRRYARNGSAFWTRFQGMLKVGLLAGAGFMGHRAISKIVSDQGLAKISALSTGPLAPYRGVLAGLLTAGLGMYAVDRFVKKQAAEVNAGIFVSLVQSLVTTALTQMGQGPIAAALSAYPDQSGPAYRGYGEYLPVSGFGDLPQLSRYGSSRIAQAAAGYGALPAITQAAAGFGVVPQLTQASAGIGEYVAQNLEGVGDYEMVGGVGSPEMTDDGIRPDLASAESALDIAEAAAGLGDIGSRSQLNPAMVTQPVSHSPSGMRSGVFVGGDGIFAK